MLNVFDGESEFHFKQYSSFQCTVNTGNFRNFDNDTKCQKKTILVRHQNDKLHRKNASKMTKRKTYYCFIPFCLLSDENLKEETERVTKIENIKTDKTKILRPTHSFGLERY